MGVGEREEPRAEPAEDDATGGGMERRLSGLERFAGGGFREEAMAVNQIQRLGNEVAGKIHDSVYQQWGEGGGINTVIQK